MTTTSTTNQAIYSASQYTTKQLILELKTPVMDDRPVYVVGNFNNWLPEDERFRMKRIKNDNFRLEFPLNMSCTQPIEYKYTRGGWENVEIDAYGSHTFNRVAATLAGVISDFVPRWVNNNNIGYVGYLPKIQTVPGFYMPQLNKCRTISILLPYNYEHSDKKYPVLYLQDGQNLCNPNSKFGNWAIDKKMAVLAERGASDVIIVTVEHGENDRAAEYAGISSKKYIDFLVETLKPYIDTRYRTKTTREHTGIGGSSLGGLVSMMAGLVYYPQIFGKLMVFSPSLWAMPTLNLDAILNAPHWQSSLYLYAGAQESKTMVPHLNRFLEGLKKYRPTGIDIQKVIHPEGQHKEVFWENAFPKALEALFFNG
jgi:predicted alpha/beta superfamily hydrolase